MEERTPNQSGTCTASNSPKQEQLKAGQSNEISTNGVAANKVVVDFSWQSCRRTHWAEQAPHWDINK
jgi:hypothetical protein